MRWTDVSDNWAAFIPRILTRWPELDENEVQSAAGEEDRFLDHLAARTGTTREDAALELREFLQGEEPLDALTHASRDNEQIRASGAHIPPGEDVYSEDGGFGDDDTAEPPIAREN